MSDIASDLSALRIERGPERPAGRGWVGWAIVLLLLVGVGAGAWWWITKPRPIEVQTSTVSARAAGAQAGILNATGYVTARREATVSSKVTGKLTEVNVEEGMAVQEGQVLARLDDSTVRAAMALAQAQADQARSAVHQDEVRLAQYRVNLARLNALLQRGLETPSDIDTAKADVDATAADMESLKTQIEVADRQIAVQQANLDDMVIRAPFTGIAISKDAQPGEMVSPVSAGGGFTRTGICTVVDMKSLEIDVDVNESYINRVHDGQDVTAMLDAYPDWQIPARVITTVPTADRQKATVEVRIAFRALDPRILPDMGVKVTFLEAPAAAGLADAKPMLLAPKSAVRSDNGHSVVFVVHGDTVERRAVDTGGTDGDRIEIRAGLQNGDRIVISPPDTLHDGSLVATTH